MDLEVEVLAGAGVDLEVDDLVEVVQVESGRIFICTILNS